MTNSNLIQMKRFQVPLNRSTLGKALQSDDESLAVVDLGQSLDTTEFRSLFNGYVESGIQGLAIPATDAEMAPVLHKCMVESGVTRSVTMNMSFWHYLCAHPLSDYVWWRWNKGSIPADPTAHLEKGMPTRFLGTATLGGVSRNALARLYWCAEALVTEDGDYGLVAEAFARQDFFQAVFERRYGLYAPAARALIAESANISDEVDKRALAKKLNRALTTVVVETLEEDEIRKLLNPTFQTG